MLRIGLSACFSHADPQRKLFKGKTLLYMEQSLVEWIQEEGVWVSLIPTGLPDVEQWVRELDGLFLHGGDDVAPEHYNEHPLRPQWEGDGIRDLYDMLLIREFRRQRKPIFGLCRGIQILNVALGGTLYQDLETQLPGSLRHRFWDLYENNIHDLAIEKGGVLEKLYPGIPVAQINSIHHQGIRELAPGLRVEARCPVDGVIEAVSGDRLLACQWHPEFETEQPTLDGKPLLRHFLKEVRESKK